ncbi:alpha/beta hydrolase [Clostridium sp. CTA-7]
MKKILKKILKFTKFSIIAAIALFIIFISVSVINNKIQLKKESKILNPPGKLVEVNNKNIHVYSEGVGDLTCVFMSGLGNVAPAIDLNPLYKEMSNEYRIAIVDRSGYGFSESSNSPRDIDTILDETRKSLTLAGEKPPYVLFPHSISGLEAIYWAQKYPSEVKAIIGLDIGFPEGYLMESERMKSNLSIMKVQSLFAKLGVHRFLPSLSLDESVLNSNLISEDDKEIYKALTYKNLSSNDIINEFALLIDNSNKSNSLDLPSKTPICIFLATPLREEERLEKKDFIEGRFKYYNDYISKFEKGELITYEAKHSIYLYSPENIAKKSKDFLKSIDN